MTNLVSKDSPRSVAGTVARFTELVTERGIKVFAVIDHRGEAKAVGLDLRETKVVPAAPLGVIAALTDAAIA